MGAMFDTDFLARLEYLALVAKRIVRGDLRADRITSRRGSGVEFADFRDYIPGDDFRYIDWNAYARLGQLLLKMYEEEQDLHVYFMLDTSLSMDSGEPDKLIYGKKLVAALAYITLSNLDRAGISFFTSDLVSEIPVARGKNRILPLLDVLENTPAATGETNLARAAEAFMHRTRRRGVVVVVSDLFDPHGFRAALDRLRFSRHQVYVIQVLAEADRDPKLLGDIELVDMESGVSKEVTVTERALTQYREAFDTFLHDVVSYGKQFEVPIVQVFSSMDMESVVLDLFRRGGLVR
jgi:uncharacterized protein (DUF58 family)